MISVLSTTKQTDQLSTLRDMLTVVSKLYDCATASSHTSTYGRTFRTVYYVRNTIPLLA
jgi:predicted choloylglycine hydrolase